MAYSTPSGSFLHATLYSSLLLQVSRELFPAQPFFDLSPDKRRLVDQEAGNCCFRPSGRLIPKASRSSSPSQCHHRPVATRRQPGPFSERGRRSRSGRGSMRKRH